MGESELGRQGVVEHIRVKPHIVVGKEVLLFRVDEYGVVYHVRPGGETVVGKAITHRRSRVARDFVEQQFGLGHAERSRASDSYFRRGVPRLVGTEVQKQLVGAEYEETHHCAVAVAVVLALDSLIECFHARVAPTYKNQRQHVHDYRYVVEKEAVGVVEVRIDIAGKVIPILHGADYERQDEHDCHLVACLAIIERGDDTVAGIVAFAPLTTLAEAIGQAPIKPDEAHDRQDGKYDQAGDKGYFAVI